MAIKVISIIGTRPEAIKMVPVIRALNLFRRGSAEKPTPNMLHSSRPVFEHVLVVTGQHRVLLDQVLGLFNLRPDYDLNIMEEGQRLDQIVTRTLARLGEIIRVEDPDCVLVQGDTTTALTGALAGFYNRVAVGHVEAGLRTSDRFVPYPEEINRRLIDQLSEFHFCPTEGARGNLLAEDLPPENMLVTGNTVADALNMVKEMPCKFSEPVEKFIGDYPVFVVVTTHRRENWGEPLNRIKAGLCAFAQEHQDIGIIISLHPNPLLRESLSPAFEGFGNVLLVPPPDYVSFVHLMERSALVVTDSGGIQEEACALKKFVLVLRKETERPEAVEAGFAKVIGTDAERIEGEISLSLELVRAGQIPPRGADNPFGDGRASERIVNFLAERLGG